MDTSDRPSIEEADSASEAQDTLSASCASGSSSVFKCDYCGSTFGRQEHLTRHKRSHTREKPFSCSTCGKSFSRLDVLTRHAASHNEVDSGSRRNGSSARACQACAVSRARCSKEHPCRRCTGRGLECRYPNARQRAARVMTGSRAKVTETPAPKDAAGYQVTSLNDTDILQEADMLQEAQPLPVSMDETTFPQSGETAGGLSIGPDWNIPHSSERQDRSMQISNSELVYGTNHLGDFTPHSSFAEQSTGISTINWLSPQCYTDLDWEMLSSQSSQGAFIATFNGTDAFMRTEELAGLGPWSNPLVHQQQETQTSLRETVTEEIPEPTGSIPGNRSTESTTGSVESSSTTATYYVDGAPARAPFKGRPSHRGMALENSARCNEDGPSSTDSMQEATVPRDTGNGQASGLLHAHAYHNLIQHINNEPFLQAPDIGSTLEALSLSQTRVCFILYFQRFHPAYPFLQKSSYDDPAHWHLLLAICAVGSRYAHGETNVRLRNLLFVLLEKTVSFNTSDEIQRKDSKFYGTSFTYVTTKDKDIAAAQTCTLYLICKIHMGKPVDLGLILVIRHFLVDAVHNLDLLEKHDTSPSEPPCTEDGRLVHDCVQKESRLRTGLMIWILDYIISLERDEKPLLSLGDAKGFLTCSDVIWDQPTREKLSPQQPRLVTIPEAMEMLYMGKRLPPGLSDFSTTVLTYAICRRTKEAVYQHQTRLNTWTPTADVQKCDFGDTTEETWPPSLPIISRWRNSACDSLDLLHWNANAIIAKAGGWEHPAILHLHLSRLVLLAPIHHLQTLATAGLARTSSQVRKNSSIERARARVVEWALNDQYKARLSVIHAGAILWHIRRYSVDNFLEPFSIFAATLVVWAYGSMMLFLKHHGNNTPGSQVAGDGSGNSRSALLSPSNTSSIDVTTEPLVDETEETPEPRFLHLDRPCDDEMVQTYVRLGHKMSGHMSRVGDICKHGAPQKILQEGIRMMGQQYDGGLDTANRVEGGDRVVEEIGYGVWGIERHYSDLLASLIQTSSN